MLVRKSIKQIIIYFGRRLEVSGKIMIMYLHCSRRRSRRWNPIGGANTRISSTRSVLPSNYRHTWQQVETWRTFRHLHPVIPAITSNVHTVTESSIRLQQNDTFPNARLCFIINQRTYERQDRDASKIVMIFPEMSLNSPQILCFLIN